jgi:enoyl-CoA hydratase/carnithine racemase
LAGASGKLQLTIHQQRIGAHAALLEIDNPPANALGRAAREAFMAALDEYEHDKDIRCLVVTGRGANFCSGDDLKEQEAAQSGGLAARKAQLAEFVRVLERVENFRVPVIAAANGWCIGGGLELALCCDIRIASDQAKFVCAGVNVGLMASAYRLPRLIGVARAKHMLLTGLPHDAQTAERFGLVTGVHPHAALIAEATKLAERIASRAPLSIEATKRTATLAVTLSPEDAGRAMQKELDVLVKSADHAEALAAFREKRDPKFTRT